MGRAKTKKIVKTSTYKYYTQVEIFQSFYLFIKYKVYKKDFLNISNFKLLVFVFLIFIKVKHTYFSLKHREKKTTVR